MSKAKEDNDSANDLINPNENSQPAGSPGLKTIEEHRENLGIGAPVFAAVMQSEGWAAGKKVPEATFIKAVETFLGAPMGGR